MKKYHWTKKIFSIALAVCLLLSCMPVSARAAAAVSYIKRDWIGGKVTETTMSTSNYTVVNGGDNAVNWTNGNYYVVNKNVTINNRVYVSGTVHLILTAGYTLTVEDGIDVPMTATLHIYSQESNGKLNAGFATDGFGNKLGTHAGIGSGESQTSGSIHIHGGNITAKSYQGGAAIGSGKGGECGRVYIYGGTVTAEGDTGAGIGSGDSGIAGKIYILGGQVKANANSGGAAIGGGKYTDGGEVHIYGGDVIANGSSGAGIGGGRDGNGGTVRIEGGTVTADGGNKGAGIGGGSEADGGIINISGGKITAKASSGAGIGGGDQGSGGTVNISGGEITATAYLGAGIGGGEGGSGGTVTISGGAVTATIKDQGSGAGIGGGKNGNGGSLTITDGTVIAKGSENGAGFGGGYKGNGGTVTISGGMVTATGGAYAAGIGGGEGGSGGMVTISGGTVTATGGTNGAGIGGGSGEKGTGGKVTISGGTVTATGSGEAAGIGGGYFGAGGTVNIDGGTVVATGGAEAAGIGGGRCGKAGSVTITGGTVTATAGANGNGIGAGNERDGGDVVITGGNVKATGNNRNDIGGSKNKNQGTLTDGKGNNVKKYTLALEAGDVASAASVTGLTNYGLKDVTALDENMVYLYLPDSAPSSLKVGENVYCRGNSTAYSITGHASDGVWHQENGYHYQICTTCGGKAYYALCEGGISTCAEQAVCEGCGLPYGTVDTHNHVPGIAMDEDGFCPNGCYLAAELVDGIYQISKPGQLFWLAQQLSDGRIDSFHAVLTQDITIPSDKAWTPIATVNTSSFDGNDHTITMELTYAGDENFALFGTYNGSYIKNLTLRGDITASTSGYVAALVAEGADTAISNVVSYVDVTNNGTGYAGGLVGHFGGELENCAVYGDVTGGNYTGGLVAELWGGLNECTITNAAYVGDVTGDKAGAIAGHLPLNNKYYPGEFTNIYWCENDGLAFCWKKNAAGYYNFEMTEAKSQEAFASGEVAYLLGEGWGQRIGSDPLPVLKGEQVYYGFTSCDPDQPDQIYTNSETQAEKPVHSTGAEGDLEASCSSQAYCSVCEKYYGEKIDHESAIVFQDGKFQDICSVCTQVFGTVTLVAESGEYNGEQFYAQVETTGTLADTEWDITYVWGEEVLEGAPKNAGTYTASITDGENVLTVEFTIEKRPLQITDVWIEKSYDGTANGEVSFVFFDEIDGDDVYLPVDLDLTCTLEGSDIGVDYTRIYGLHFTYEDLLGEDKENYTFTPDPDGNYTVAEYWIDPATLKIKAGYQYGTELDPEGYTVSGLLEGHTLSGVALYLGSEEWDADTIYINSENLKVTDAQGNDVTECYSLSITEGRFYLTHEGHDFNEYGFCATGECTAYEAPGMAENEYGEIIYQIANAGQLYWFADYVNSTNSYAAAVLTADIVVPENAPNWIPIGGSNAWSPYTGSFDGQFHVISGLKCIAEGSYAGLFGYTDYANTIQNIGIINSYFEGAQYASALIGLSYSNIYNCYVTNTTVKSESGTAGGLVGYLGSYINSCYSTATVIGKSAHGLVGYYSSGYGEIDHCYYLADAETEDGGRTAEQFASGRVAYELQSGVPEEDIYDDDWNYIETVTPHIWGQTIGTEACPVWKGEKVYGGYLDCGEMQYGNAPLPEERPAHTGEIRYTQIEGTEEHQGVYDCCGTVAVDSEYCFGEVQSCMGYKCETCGGYFGEGNDAHDPNAPYSEDGYCLYCGAYEPAQLNGEGWYEIGNVGQLIWFAQLVNGGEAAANAKLIGDIDMDGVDWTPIGSTKLYYNDTNYTEKDYEGTFDGNGHVIRNLSITGSASGDYSYGLFGTLSGSVKMLGIEGFTYTGAGKDSRVGAIVGQMIDGSKVENCYARNVNINTQVGTTNGVAGGIAGCNYAGTIANCYTASVNITAGRYAGIVGDNCGDGGNTDRPGVVDNCWTSYSTVVSKGKHTNSFYSVREALFASDYMVLALNKLDADGVWKKGNDYPAFSSTAVTKSAYEEPKLAWNPQYELNFYQITNKSELYWFAEQVNFGNGFINAILLNDIDLEGDIWIPIGHVSSPFSGYFEGNGKTIALGERTVTESYYGIIGYSDDYEFKSAVYVENITVTGSFTVDAKVEYVAAIVGYANSTNIRSCISYVDITLTEKAADSAKIAGIAGGLYNSYCGSVVDKCANYGDIVANGAKECVAGITGYSSGTNYIQNSGNYGDITANGVDYVAGILGYVNYANFNGIYNCLNMGNITSDNTYAGDIAGWARNFVDGSIKNNYYTGEKAWGAVKSGMTVEATKVTEAQLKSGEVAYLLGMNWGQKLPEEEYPIPGGQRVYWGYEDCQATEAVYSNKDSLDPEMNAHKYENGFCVGFKADGTKCDHYQAAVKVTADNLAELGLEESYIGYYAIGNAGQLYWFAAVVNSGYDDMECTQSLNGVLTGDITVNADVLDDAGALNDGSFRTWIPIGRGLSDPDSVLPFNGSFDGAGYAVSGLYFNDPEADFVGFFGGVIGNSETKVQIRNVKIEDSLFLGKKYVGGIAGYVQDTVFENCANGAMVSGSEDVGGIVGHCKSNSLVEGCSNSGAVTGIAEASKYIGGIVGCLGSGAVNDCSNSGNVTANGSGASETAGIAGCILQGASLDGCANSGAISAFKNVGGLGGYVSGSIKNSVNSGAVVGNAYVGGLAGSVSVNGSVETSCNTGAISGGEHVGGLAGITDDTSCYVHNCYNIGNISCTSDASDTTLPSIAGLVASNYGTLRDCYSSCTISYAVGQEEIAGVVSFNAGSIINCYFNSTLFTGAGIGYDNSKTGEAIGMKAQQFRYGEVGWLLQGEQEEQIWGQNLDNGEAEEAYPVFSDAVIYQTTNCQGQADYTNLEGASGMHRYVNGFCINSSIEGSGCDHYQAAVAVTADNLAELGLDESYIGYYAIGNAGQLYWFAAVVNGGYDGMSRNVSMKGVLTADITINENVLKDASTLNEGTFRAWVPMGDNTSAEKRYQGIFDGAGFAISGLYYSGSADYVGLFGAIHSSSVIKNVTLKDSWIENAKQNGHTGGLVGYCHGQVVDCVNYAAVNVNGTNNKGGGIIGTLSGGRLKECVNYGSINGLHNSPSIAIGGLVGEVANSGAIEKCVNYGSVIAVSSNNIGGLVGYLARGSVTNCYNRGTVAENNGKAAGLIGWAGIGNVTNCYTADSGANYKVAYKKDTATFVNCYYEGEGTPVYSGSAEGMMAMSSEAFASGAVTWLLNGETDQGDLVWFQSKEAESYPAFSGYKVLMGENGCYIPVVYDKAKLSVEGEVILKMMFYVPAGVYSVTWTEEANELEDTQTTTKLISEMTKDSEGRYEISQSIASGEMTGKVSVTFRDAKGNVVPILEGEELLTEENAFAMSVQDYSALAIAQGSEKMQNLSKNMLIFGGFAQQKFGTHTDNLAYSILYESEPDLSGYDQLGNYADQVLTQKGSISGIRYSGQKVRLDSTISLLTFFTLEEGKTLADYEFKLTYTSNNEEKTSLVRVHMVDGRARIGIENVPVAYWDYLYTITVTDLATGDTLEVTSSVLAWARRCIEADDMGDPAKIAQEKMAMAMFYYNDAANKYFEK